MNGHPDNGANLAQVVPIHTLRQYIATQGEGHGAVRLLVTVIDGEVAEVAERHHGDRTWRRPLPLEEIR